MLNRCIPSYHGKVFQFFNVTHNNGISSYFTSYMVSFCDRFTVFLPISGYRYKTEFRLKIRTGSPTEEGWDWGGGRSQGKIAEAKARPRSVMCWPSIRRPYSPMAYTGAAGLRNIRRVAPPITHHIRRQSHTTSNPSGHSAPIMRVCHPHAGSERHTHTRTKSTTAFASNIQLQTNKNGNNRAKSEDTDTLLMKNESNVKERTWISLSGYIEVRKVNLSIAP